MCPACMATVALLVAGAASTGGVAALVVGKLRAAGGEKDLPESSKETNQKEESWEKQRTSK